MTNCTSHLTNPYDILGIKSIAFFYFHLQALHKFVLFVYWYVPIVWRPYINLLPVSASLLHVCGASCEMLHALISQLVQPICVKLHYFSPVRPIRQTPFPFLVHFFCLADVLWLPNRVEAIWLLSSSSE